MRFSLNFCFTLSYFTD